MPYILIPLQSTKCSKRRVYMKYKIGDKVRVLDGSNIKDYMGGWTIGMQYSIGKVYTIESFECIADGRIGYYMEGSVCIFDERGLEPAYADGGFCTGFKGGKIPTPEKPILIEEQLGHTFKDSLNNAFDAWRKQGVSIYDLNPVECHKPMEIKLDISDLDYEEINRTPGDRHRRRSIPHAHHAQSAGAA